MMQDIINWFRSLFGSSKPASRTPLDRQLLFVGLTRFWGRENAKKSAQIVKDAGCDGRSYELLELEPRPGHMGNLGMMLYMTSQIARIKPYIEADRKLGLWSKIYWWNTNVSKNDQLAYSQHVELMNKFTREIGWEGCLVMWMNENDANTPSGIAQGVRAYGASLVPPERTIGYESTGAIWDEYHPQRIDSSPGPNGFHTIIAPDCGPTLDALADGGAEDPNVTPNIPRWREFVASNWRKQKSVDAYNFYGRLGKAWVKACRESAR